ncbi:MAG: hypothetical protein ACLRWA_00815 [Lachnospira sp.]
MPKGLTLTLEGDSNDYFGKGLSGGKLDRITHRQGSYLQSQMKTSLLVMLRCMVRQAVKHLLNGVAGERFAVRNSGATAVVEGVR